MPLRAFLARPIGAVLGLSLAVNIALLAPSIYMLQVYDRVLVTRSVETLAMLAVAALLTLVAMGALEQLRSRMLALTGHALERQVGPGVLSRLITASARQEPGAPTDGLRDLGTLRAFIGGPAVVALCDAPWAPVYLALIAAFDLRLGGLALLCAAALLGLSWAQDRSLRDHQARVQAQARATQRVAERSLHNAEVVTALGMGDALAAQWLRQLDQQQQTAEDGGQLASRLGSLTRTLRQAVQILMLGLGAWLVIRGGATPGLMIACTVLLARALAPVEQLMAQWRLLADARAAYRRLDQLLQLPLEATAATALPRPSGALTVEQLSASVPGGQRLLLRQVSLSARPGEVLAVIGGSGAGKTTLARLLVGVLRPAAGAVRLDGADIRHWDPARLGPALGYLPQDVELFAGTVAENIARFGNAQAEAVIAAAQAAQVHDFIVRLPQGYDTPVGERGMALSGGQRQRIALARALYGEPALVVLDEPDASLDGEGEDALVAAIAGLKARGATVVAVTQRRRLLSVADQVVVLKEGSVERTVARNEAPQNPPGDVPRDPAQSAPHNAPRDTPQDTPNNAATPAVPA
ncbi:type I secretion system permease/ATPase [Ideonella sp. 4Y16]|uniref:type I secretion system permease/ATPase n=1 Tax=Ideonella alba TaxID=2824118 RepID=UPI001B35F82C|nr:type I secretion system permease/ATPase [Ideonella alba]MBQ0943040.1 type I secretion system permease/ATPase [Ideonella alba]